MGNCDFLAYYSLRPRSLYLFIFWGMGRGGNREQLVKDKGLRNYEYFLSDIFISFGLCPWVRREMTACPVFHPS